MGENLQLSGKQAHKPGDLVSPRISFAHPHQTGEICFLFSCFLFVFFYMVQQQRPHSDWGLGE